MRLKFLHALGLTNLSDDDVIKYYKISDGSLKHASFSAFFWMQLCKRFMDVLLSISLLTYLAPFMVLVAIIIKATSPGPVFHKQKRTGLKNKEFYLYKFRTMHDIGEGKELDEFYCDFNNLDRITPLGKLLRRTCIDEIPQIFNILKGEMSFVGPRPLPMRTLDEIDSDWIKLRSSVLPGITCLWQVSVGGQKGFVAFENWKEFDILYVNTWSLWLDFKILGKTILAVLKVSSTTRLEWPVRWFNSNECRDRKRRGESFAWR